MGLEGCMHLSTISSTRSGGIVRPDVAVWSKQKLKVGSRRGLMKISSSLSFSSSSSFNSFVHERKDRNFSIVCKAQGAVNEVQVVTDSSWNNLVVSNESPVLVEFWAPWCGPCRMIAPIIDELAKEYAGQIACYKLNTDDCPSIATQYGIKSIPTVLVFKNGEKKESVIGAVPKSTLTATIEKYIES